MIQPLNMVVMYDKSGSMGDTDESSSYLPSLRWLPVGDAMKAFFAQGASAGINAYLSFFPNAAVWSTNPQHCYSANRYTTDQCNVANYNTVPPRTPLPSTGLANIIDGAQPCGDTPTRAALDGAYAQIANIKAGHPQEQTVLVLVTDGEPTDHCAAYGNTINEIVPVVTGQRTTNRVSTYVVGVGPSVDNMTRIATAGGTTLFHVDVGSSSTTTQQLLDAMTQIRGQLAKCDFPIPSPSDGRTLDYNKVNVSFTKNGSTQLLAYNPACSGGTGWKFDVEPGAAGATPT